MIYIFLSNGFEEIEAISVIDVLRRAGLSVCMVSTDAQTVLGGHQIPVVADKLFADCDFSDAEMLILPGGSTRLSEHEGLAQLLLRFNAENKLIAAICAAPMVLGKLGILKGKQATCYPGFESYLGNSYIGGILVESHNIITAKGPGVAFDFALCIVEKLLGKEVADQISDTAIY